MTGQEDPRHQDALIRIGGLDALGLEGFHNVDDQTHYAECPGCWAWWGMFGTVEPTQGQLNDLRAKAHLDPEWVKSGKQTREA